eukprot:1394740-Rhodomonas_salina.1
MRMVMMMMKTMRMVMRMIVRFCRCVGWRRRIEGVRTGGGFGGWAEGLGGARRRRRPRSKKGAGLGVGKEEKVGVAGRGLPGGWWATGSTP